MKKAYYLFNPGRLQRRDNTLKFTPYDEEGHEQAPRFLPVENVRSCIVLGRLKPTRLCTISGAGTNSGTFF